MSDWTPGSFLFWLVIAIAVPAVIVHFTLGRKGGHRFFDKDGLTPDEVGKLPLEMLKKRTVWSLKGTAAAIAGVVVASALFAVLPIEQAGPSREKGFFLIAGAVVVLLTLGPALYRKMRG